MHSRLLLACQFALLICLASSAQALVAAPQFLPGQPMVVGDQVLMLWAPVPGAAQYAVFHNGREIARVSSNQYLGALPEEPGEHRFQVASVTALGAVGTPGEPGTIKVRRIGKPAGVVAQTNTATEAIDLIWNKVEGALIYNVYRWQGGEDKQLVASVQSETFKDAQVSAGVEYNYTITAKDLSGQEGPPSAPVAVTMVGGRKQMANRVTFRALPTTEVLSLTMVADRPLERLSYLGAGPAGNLWLVTPQQRTLHSLDPDGELRFTWGPFEFEETGYRLLPHKLAHGPDGRIYLSDAINGVLVCLGPDGELLWARGIPTPPASELELWQDFPAHMQAQLATPSSVLCREDELWVTDQRFQLIYRLDYNGAVQGYITHYRVGEERLRLPGVGELLGLDQGATLLTFPLSHSAARMTPETKVAAQFGVGVRGYIGGFVGIHGVSAWDAGSVIVTDPAVASLQVFDVASGRYRHHISGPDPRPDPDHPQRADLPLRKPNLAVRAGDGKLWVYDAAERRISVRRVSGVVTPPLDGG